MAVTPLAGHVALCRRRSAPLPNETPKWRSANIVRQRNRGRGYAREAAGALSESSLGVPGVRC